MPPNDSPTHRDDRSNSGDDSAQSGDAPPELHFAYATSEPNLAAFDVKRVVPSELCGEPAALTVIGESHYVGVPALDFHEVCSCRPVSDDSTGVTPLERGVEREFTFETDRVRVETDAEVRPIEAFPGADGADAAFRFGPDAWTTIALDPARRSERAAETDESVPAAAATYETYHTYPERGLAVYTHTRLHRTRRAREAPASRTPADTDDTSHR